MGKLWQRITNKSITVQIIIRNNIFLDANEDESIIDVAMRMVAEVKKIHPNAIIQVEVNV